MHQIHGSIGPQLEQRSLARASSLPPSSNRRGRLIWSADEKVSLFSVHFDGKQCRDCFQNPDSSDLSPVLCSVAFRSSFVHSLSLDLDLYGGSEPDEIFPLLQTSGSRAGT